MLALDVARIEAGLLLIDVDFNGSKKCLIEAQRYTPYELGLGRLVSESKAPFVGRAALAAERRTGPKRQVVGLEISWDAIEALYGALKLPTQVATTASRVHVPVYKGGRQVGRATSTSWSPTLKQLIALATIDAPAHGARHCPRRRDHRRGRAPPRRRPSRADPVLQSRAENGDAATIVRSG